MNGSKKENPSRSLMFFFTGPAYPDARSEGSTCPPRRGTRDRRSRVVWGISIARATGEDTMGLDLPPPDLPPGLTPPPLGNNL